MKKVFTLFAMLVMLTSVAFADVIEVTIPEDGLATTYYAEDNDLYIVMADDVDNPTYAFCFDVVCPTGQTDITDGVPYTYASDMITGYSYMADYNLQEYVGYKSVTLVRSAGSYDVQVTDSNDRQFHIVYTYVAPITDPKDTVDVDLRDVTFQNRVFDYTATSTEAFQLIGRNDEWIMNVVFKSTTFAGTYTLDDMYSKDYMCLYHIEDGDTNLIKVSNVLANVNGNATNCNAIVNYIGKDSTKYVIYFEYVDPYIGSTEQFAATDGLLNADLWDLYWAYLGYGAFTVEASNTDYLFYMIVYTDNEEIPGLYTVDQNNVSVYFYNPAGTELIYETFSGDLTVTTEPQMTVTGDVLCYGNVLFNINISGVVPVENVEASEYNVYNEGRTIVLNGAEGQNAAIYDMAGRMISNTTVNSDNARFEVGAAGVYVVRVNGESFRVVVK